MKIRLNQLRKIIRETVRDTLLEGRGFHPPELTARYLQVNYGADLEELVNLRDSLNDPYKFKDAALRAMGQASDMNLNGKLVDFWYDTKGMSAEDLQAAIDAPPQTAASSGGYEGRFPPKPLPGGGYYTGD